MMRYLPDTNVWIRHLNPAPSVVKARLAERSAAEIMLCDVVKAELYYGAFKSARRARNLALLHTLFDGIGSFPFDGRVARVFGEIRADLARKGTLIGPYDMQIAATALAHRCVLVTHDTNEFSRIVGLQLEDWETV